ncbi:hypothetical protein [Listeria ilorinensis]|uniref:hypothetical protein n=1 Tax=Listeria ilorinensis TaxID=2867439 RepID=UPI001EF57661|nr:hypothetical protein [Listeria ilorinensis]
MIFTIKYVDWIERFDWTFALFSISEFKEKLLLEHQRFSKLGYNGFNFMDHILGDFTIFIEKFDQLIEEVLDHPLIAKQPLRTEPLVFVLPVFDYSSAVEIGIIVKLDEDGETYLFHSSDRIHKLCLNEI